MSARTDIRQRLIDEFEGFLAHQGYELVQVEYDPPRRKLAFYIDQEGGTKIDDCERVSKLIGPALDVMDLIPGGYSLEVSTPGVNRPLRKISDFERFVGKRIRLTTHSRIEGRRRFSGRLQGVDGEEICIDDGEKHYRFPFEAVASAKLNVL